MPVKKQTHADETQEEKATLAVIQPAQLQPKNLGILDDSCIPTSGVQVVAHAPSAPAIPLATEGSTELPAA